MDYLTLRFISAFLSGMLLSQSGSLIQLGTRNILASPSTLGIEGLSVLWILVSHSLFLFLGGSFPWGGFLGVPLFALLGWLISRGKESFRLETTLLLGLTFNLLVGAVFSLWQFLFLAFNLPFPMEVWFGNFRHVEGAGFLFLLALELLFFVAISVLGKDLRLYSLGRQVARAHRARLTLVHGFFLSFSFAGTFLVISLFGAFSFLGLIFPLLARKLWFRNFDLKGELIIGAMINGLVLALADLGTYHFTLMGAEIPVGLIASVLGALCLTGIIVNRRRSPDFLANSRN